MKVSVHGHVYNHRRDKKDKRDHVFVSRVAARELPNVVDLRKEFPPVWDQGREGSCGAQAGSAIHAACQIIQHTKTNFEPSRQALYYDVREKEGTVQEDAGCMLRDVAERMATLGVAPESLWPYSKPMSEKPPKSYYIEAEKHQVLEYTSPQQRLDQLCVCLADGFPFMVGIQIFASFESEEVTRTGIVPMPKRGWSIFRFGGEKLLGGHAVVVCGYDMDRRMFLARNSWGKIWGKDGYFWIPFDYLLDKKLASDFWTVRLVE